MAVGLLGGGVMGERHRRGGAHRWMGLDGRVDVWWRGLSSMGLQQGCMMSIEGGDPSREETAQRRAAVAGRSAVFKVKARHDMAMWLWRVHGARWPRASDRRAPGGGDNN
jgi:hypothetical protein